MKCKICNIETSNKKYCSVNCQYKGYAVIKVKRIFAFCLNCNSQFETTKNKIDNGKGKYCCRQCKDKHLKIKFSGKNNPMFGKTTSQTQKLFCSENTKKQWKSKEFRENFKLKAEEYYKKNGCFYGTDEKSVLKKKNTFIEKYNVDHNWKVPEIRQKCENTTFELYGESSLDLARKKLLGQSTKIEKIIENILSGNSIVYQKQYRLYFNESEYKTYDFYLKDKKILIEADGDFWHANPLKYNSENLHPIQLINLKNDKLKNELALKFDIKLIRFWETDIKSKDFDKLFLTTLSK